MCLNSQSDVPTTLFRRPKVDPILDNPPDAGEPGLPRSRLKTDPRTRDREMGQLDHRPGAMSPSGHLWYKT